MRPRHWIAIAVVVLIAIVLAATWVWRSPEAPEVTEMRQLTTKMLDPNTQPQERVEIGEKMRQLKQNIPEDRRQKVYREMGEDFRQQINAHVREFSALPKDQRNAFLDRDIDMKRMSAAKVQWRKAKQRQNNDRPQTSEQKPNKIDSMSKERLAALKRAKLDNTSAEDRAYMMEYITALKQRMQERGFDSWDKD